MEAWSVAAEAEGEADQEGSDEAVEEEDDGWTCSECTYFNTPERSNCVMCSAPNPHEAEDDQSPDGEEDEEEDDDDEEQDEEEGDEEEGDEGDEQEAALAGCDANCEGSHRRDGDCLICGNDWCGSQFFRLVNKSVVIRGEHNGHTCTSGGHDGERGSWLVVCMSSHSRLIFVETLLIIVLLIIDSTLLSDSIRLVDLSPAGGSSCQNEKTQGEYLQLSAAICWHE